jgi:glycine/D-amino acid oxidase-like deaminating enzyme
MSSPTVLVVGGGAAGYFSAIAAAETGRGRVILCEATAQPLAKVRISGGGRCNVTHACPEPRELVKRYPRGGRELLGAFHRFGPRDTIAWFAERGVELKTEPDGRMFPTTNTSSTIVDCLQGAAARAGVEVRTRCGVTAVTRLTGEGGFEVTLSTGDTERVDRLILAQGGPKTAPGRSLAESLGHALEPSVPSLFTFHIDDPSAEGPLRTVGRRRGVVGAGHVAARTRPRADHALGIERPGGAQTLRMGRARAGSLQLPVHPRRELLPNPLPRSGSRRPHDPSRPAPEAAGQQWRTVHPAEPSMGALWSPPRGSVRPRRGRRRPTMPSKRSPARSRPPLSPSRAKSTNKEEFVTCGGVKLTEVDFRTLESRKVPRTVFLPERCSTSTGSPAASTFRRPGPPAGSPVGPLRPAPPSPADALKPGP